MTFVVAVAAAAVAVAAVAVGVYYCYQHRLWFPVCSKLCFIVILIKKILNFLGHSKYAFLLFFKVEICSPFLIFGRMTKQVILFQNL